MRFIFSDKDKARPGYEFIICHYCGGYGIHFRTERGNAVRCEMCHGRKYMEKPLGK